MFSPIHDVNLAQMPNSSSRGLASETRTTGIARRVTWAPLPPSMRSASIPSHLTETPVPSKKSVINSVRINSQPVIPIHTSLEIISIVRGILDNNPVKKTYH